MADPIHYTEHAPDVLAKAAEFCAAGVRYALITSLDIKGGSARECGSLAVVAEDGAMYGYLSNGCVDRDIQLRAKDALSKGEKVLVNYGAGSQNFDLKLPCGGSLGVLIDPAPACDAILAASKALAARAEAELLFQAPGTGDAKTFVYQPKFRLFLAGRGAVFRSVVEAAAAAGFEVDALTPDEDDLAAVAAHTPRAPHRLMFGADTDALAQMDAHSAFLTLFHDHDWEVHLLAQALATPVRYVGCMGSRRTHAARCEALRLSGVPDDQIARAQGPIGLVPSLRDAKLIAISALAEVAALRPNAIEERAVSDLEAAG